jgi:hypothetical protein
MKTAEKNVCQIELVKKELEDKKGQAIIYLGLMTKTLSLPSPLDSETTSLSSDKSM